MSAPLVAAWNRRLARIARRLWQRRDHRGGRIVFLPLRLSLGSDVISVYGPRLTRNWADITFVFCATGAYGPYLADFLAAREAPFTFIDIGANQGIYALIAARNPNARTIHAIEPVPETFARLEANLALNGAEATAHNLAIAASDGIATLRIKPKHSGGAGFATEGDAVTVHCRNRSLFDEIAAGNPPPVVVKIDVEGAEAIVVEELVASALMRLVDYVFVEMRDRPPPRGTAKSVTDALTRAGFVQIERVGSGARHDVMFERRAPRT